MLGKLIVSSIQLIPNLLEMCGVFLLFNSQLNTRHTYVVCVCVCVSVEHVTTRVVGGGGGGVGGREVGDIICHSKYYLYIISHLTICITKRMHACYNIRTVLMPTCSVCSQSS